MVSRWCKTRDRFTGLLYTFCSIFLSTNTTVLRPNTPREPRTFSLTISRGLEAGEVVQEWQGGVKTGDIKTRMLVIFSMVFYFYNPMLNALGDSLQTSEILPWDLLVGRRPEQGLLECQYRNYRYKTKDHGCYRESNNEYPGLPQKPWWLFWIKIPAKYIMAIFGLYLLFYSSLTLIMYFWAPCCSVTLTIRSNGIVKIGIIYLNPSKIYPTLKHIL